MTSKYIDAVPGDSRAIKNDWEGKLPADKLDKVRALNAIAQERGQSMAQLALAWTLRHKGMTSALIGASKSAQIVDAVGALDKLDFAGEELARIEAILGG